MTTIGAGVPNANPERASPGTSPSTLRRLAQTDMRIATSRTRRLAPHEITLNSPIIAEERARTQLEALENAHGCRAADSALRHRRVGYVSSLSVSCLRSRAPMVWEERWHPLRREWVVISSHRDRRPWRGETVGEARAPRTDYDPGCYLCPGNARVSGRRNPDYTGVFAFDNDHPCVGPEATEPPALPPGPYRNRRAGGLSRVVCYSPGHDRSLAELPHNEIVALLEELQRQFRELASRPEVRHVLMF